MGSTACYTFCSWVYLNDEDTTECTRNIYDGTKDTARLWFQVKDIRYSPNEDSEVDIYIKIYEKSTGGSEELVYEGTDTVIYGYGKVYYKYNHWVIDFDDIETDGSEVTMRIGHKPLCPACTIGYLCDCKDTVSVSNETYTRALILRGGLLYEQCQVRLISVAENGSSCYVNIRILDMYEGGGDVLYNQNVVINDGGYVSVSQGDMELNWRIYAKDIYFSLVDFQLCHSFEDSGQGNGSGGATGDFLVAGQYFDTRGWGYSGGCIIKAGMENPYSNGGKCTVPSEVRMKLYEWNTDYNTTVAGTILGQDKIIIPVEEMITDFYNELHIPFIFDYDAPPGEYLWVLDVLEGSHDGSFFLKNVYGAAGDKWTGYINGVADRSYVSEIMGLETGLDYQKVISTNDRFGNNLFKGTTGHPDIYVNNNTDGYNNVLTSKSPHNAVSSGNGTISDIVNPSFETGDFSGWNIISGYNTVEVSNQWHSQGSYSVKYTMNPFQPNTPVIWQYMTFNNISDKWKLMWDMYVSGSANWYLFINMGVEVYKELAVNGTHLNMSVDIPLNASTQLYISTQWYSGNDSKLIYLDNLRLVQGTPDPTPSGRIVGGASNVKVM